MKPTHRDDLKYNLNLDFLECDIGRSLYAESIVDKNNKVEVCIKGLDNFTKDELEILKSLVRVVHDKIK